MKSVGVCIFLINFNQVVAFLPAALESCLWFEIVASCLFQKLPGKDYLLLGFVRFHKQAAFCETERVEELGTVAIKCYFDTLLSHPRELWYDVP